MEPPRSGAAMAIDVATAHQKFTAALQKAQLRDTPQRHHILDIFLATTEPVTYDELHGLARRKDPRIGFTTVYRALKLMVECGLACEVEPLAQAKCPRCSTFIVLTEEGKWSCPNCGQKGDSVVYHPRHVKPKTRFSVVRTP